MERSLGDIETLIREEKRLCAAESHHEAWAEAIASGIEPEIVADAAVATAFAELVRAEGDTAALALVDRIRERIVSGEFTTCRTKH